MARVFVQISADDADRATVDGSGARHLRARRLRPGDHFEAIVAPGEVRIARIESLSNHGAELWLGEAVPAGEVDPPSPLILACALADLSRFDTVVEKATELGASAVLPFRANRSQFSRPTASRQARWERLALAACEQCGRTSPPRIFESVDFDQVAQVLPRETHQIAFDPTGETLWGGDAPAKRPLALFIGPEGGFTPEEIGEQRARGAEIRSLGPRILRFETAAIAALTIAGLIPSGR